MSERDMNIVATYGRIAKVWHGEDHVASFASIEDAAEHVRRVREDTFLIAPSLGVYRFKWQYATTEIHPGYLDAFPINITTGA